MSSHATDLVSMRNLLYCSCSCNCNLQIDYVIVIFSAIGHVWPVAVVKQKEIENEDNCDWLCSNKDDRSKHYTPYTWAIVGQKTCTIYNFSKLIKQHFSLLILATYTLMNLQQTSIDRSSYISYATLCLLCVRLIVGLFRNYGRFSTKLSRLLPFGSGNFEYRPQEQCCQRPNCVPSCRPTLMLFIQPSNMARYAEMERFSMQSTLVHAAIKCPSNRDILLDGDHVRYCTTDLWEGYDVPSLSLFAYLFSAYLKIWTYFHGFLLWR